MTGVKSNIQAVITAGEPVARKIKQAFFAEIPWSKCAMDVGYKLAEFKKLTRPWHPEIDEIQLLHKLAAYSETDILEAFNIHKPMETQGKPSKLGMFAHPKTHKSAEEILSNTFKI